jgi:hypothetical protein
MIKIETRRRTPVIIYKGVTVSTLTYGCENWGLNSGDKRKVKGAEI